MRVTAALNTRCLQLSPFGKPLGVEVRERRQAVFAVWFLSSFFGFVRKVCVQRRFAKRKMD